MIITNHCNNPYKPMRFGMTRPPQKKIRHPGALQKPQFRYIDVAGLDANWHICFNEHISSGAFCGVGNVECWALL